MRKKKQKSGLWKQILGWFNLILVMFWFSIPTITQLPKVHFRLRD